ncbi:hypothetical protein WDB89_11585 [Pseudoalteromonas sp. B5MOD-1]
MNRSIFIILIIYSTLGFSLSAEEDNPKIDLEPVILDADSNDKKVLALEYKIEGLWKKINFGKDDNIPDGGVIRLEDIEKYGDYGILELGYNLNGTIAENTKENSKNFLESEVDAKFFLASESAFSAGGFVKYESDQSFDNTQFAYGISGAFVQQDFLSDKDTFALALNLGQVDPKDNKAREEAYGKSDLEKYDRLDLEFFYSFNIGKEYLSEFEVSYRYFKELSPDIEIKNAKLDKFKMLTYLLRLENNFFIAYSTGELPFNKADDQIFEIGYSYKFK